MIGAQPQALGNEEGVEINKRVLASKKEAYQLGKTHKFVAAEGSRPRSHGRLAGPT